jgi:heat shock protein HslJ
MNLPHSMSCVSGYWKIATVALFLVTAGCASDVNGSSGEDLLGTWSVEYIGDRPVIDFSPASITFGEDGRISGSASCNRFSGNYELSGSTLTIGRLGVTRKACVDTLMEQERRFLETIDRVVTWEIANGLLQLRDANRETVFRAARQTTRRITGSASYRERIALPPDAVFEAVLEDVSKADVPAERIGEVRIQSLDSVPVQFEIPYHPGRIDARFSYSVRATIRVGGRLWATTDQLHPVLTRSNGSDVQLRLRLIPQ